MLTKQEQTKRGKKYINIFRKEEARSYYIKKIDALISRRVRERDNWTCIYCGKQEIGGMTNSHFWNRNKISVRWDMDNCDTACWACHKYRLEHAKQGWYRTFKLKQLGKDRYDYLEVKAHSPAGWNKNDLKILLLSYERGML